MTMSIQPSRWQHLQQATLVRLLLALFATTLAGGLAQQWAADQLRGTSWAAVSHLCGALAALLAYVAYVRVVERRGVAELAARPAARELGLGLAGGALLVVAVVGALAALGVYRFERLNPGLAGLPAGLAQMVFVGVMEELIMRAILMRLLERALGTWAALLLSALLFGVGHLPGDGAGVLAMVVAITAGAFFGAAYLATGRLWLPLALHVGWNFTLGHVFALVVSGHERTAGLLEGHLAGLPWLTGSTYGLEASSLTLVLLLGGTALLLARAVALGRIVPHGGAPRVHVNGTIPAQG